MGRVQHKAISDRFIQNLGKRLRTVEGEESPKAQDLAREGENRRCYRNNRELLPEKQYLG
ncbi:MAG: hypothetical protein ACM37W_09145 [Actinomycetota bacterium]